MLSFILFFCIRMETSCPLTDILLAIPPQLCYNIPRTPVWWNGRRGGLKICRAIFSGCEAKSCVASTSEIPFPISVLTSLPKIPPNRFPRFLSNFGCGVEHIVCRRDGMADVTDSKSVPGDRVWVQVPPPAPNRKPQRAIFEAFLLPIFRCWIVAQDCVCGRYLGAVIQMGVDVGSRCDVAVTEPFLNIFQIDAVGIQEACAAMPLWYIKDKPGKP